VSKPKTPVVRAEVQPRIRLLRGAKVILDAELAALYGVEIRALTQAVKRNLARFPDDFMFQLSAEEAAHLKSQAVTSSLWGGRRSLPYAFTEQGVAMLSSVLRSSRAILANVEVMRAFVRLRSMLVSHETLARHLAALESKYDAQFKVVFDAIPELAEPPAKPRRSIGFQVREGVGAATVVTANGGHLASNRPAST